MMMMMMMIVPFTDCIGEINNTQIDKAKDCNGTRTHNHLVRKRTLNHLATLAIQSNAKDIDAVMQIYNLIEYSNNCSKASGNLWQYY